MDYHFCPQCGGEPTSLGCLGLRMHLRCRQCGWVYSVLLDPDDVPEEE